MVGTVRIFSYGTLQLQAVQTAIFGRTLSGTPDAMVGWALEPIVISDPDVVDKSGLAVHTIARPSGKASDHVDGVVYEITVADLAAADLYETDAYGRVEVDLASGVRAWVYVGPPLDAPRAR